MVSCSNCATQNTLDSAFCRKCGAGLSQQEIEEAQSKLDRLIAQGSSALNEGRVSDAELSAEAALEANPTMVSALALMSDCRSRRGDLAGALEILDRIVDLNPDSELDRIKRNKLRTQLQESIRVPNSPNRRLAVVAAAAAVVLVVTMGILGAKYMQGQAEERAKLVAANDRNASVDPNENNLSANPATDANPTTPAVQPSANQQSPVNPPPAAGNVGAISEGSAERPAPRPSVNRDLPLPRYDANGTLPNPAESGMELRPVNPPSPNQNPTRPSTDPDPATPPTKSTPPPATEPEPDPGEIEIKIRGGDSKPAVGGSSRTDGAAAAMMNAARQQQLTNNAQGATGSLEKARDAGADPVFVNQRLGMNYARQGKKEEAMDAYQRAIAAGNAALAEGRGDKDRIKKAIGFCEQAIKVLKGG